MDDSKTVKEVVQEGVQGVMDLLKEYEEVNMKFAEPMSDEEMDKLMTRQGELTELIEHHGGWEIDQKLERAMDALRCPNRRSEVLSGRTSSWCTVVACCCRNRIFCCWMS